MMMNEYGGETMGIQPGATKSSESADAINAGPSQVTTCLEESVGLATTTCV